MQSATRSQGSQGGFTLVEMAIVLVIIGIILAGVMKGRDIIRGAQVKEFSQGFAMRWVNVSGSYFDKTGFQLGDGPNAGGTAAVADGQADNFWLTAGPGPETNAAGRQNMVNTLVQAGISVCEVVKTNLTNAETWCDPLGSGINPNIYDRLVNSDVGGQSTVTVGFFSTTLPVADGVGGVVNVARNVTCFRNVPLDMAIGIDKQVDGIADGTQGTCLNVTTANGGIVADANPGGGGVSGLTNWFAFPAGSLVTMCITLDY